VELSTDTTGASIVTQFSVLLNLIQACEIFNYLAINELKQVANK